MTHELRQGPKAGRHWPSETETYEDPASGATVRRLTNYPGTDNRHLYFTEDGWYDDGRRLLVRGRREGTGDLYSVDLETGLITQLTDLPGDVEDVTCHPESATAYFWFEGRITGLDLDSLDVWTVYETPEEYSDYGGSMPGVTADGETVCFSLVEDAVPKPTFSGNRAEGDADGDGEDGEDGTEDGDVDREDWIDEMFEARPRSRVMAIPADGDGEAETLVDVERWLGHVNTSPERPDLLTYCEEGTWERVDNRIWVLNRETGETWRVRPTDEDEAVGHEYWLADGEHVGYHGWRGSRDDPDPFFGVARYDGTDRREGTAPDIYTHFHCNAPDMVVGDGTFRGVPHNLLWSYDESADEFRGPRKLATHGWTGDDDAHPHSRVGPDDETVAFDSTRAGDTSDVYLVDVPDFEELPKHDLS